MFLGITTRIGKHLRAGAYWRIRAGRTGRAAGSRAGLGLLVVIGAILAAARWW